MSAIPLCVVGSGAEPQDSAGIEYFEKHIRPVLVNECYECHSDGADSLGGLQLDSREAMLQGGDHGPALVPGDVRGSLLISALRHQDLEMPPEGKLDSGTISKFERWVRMGAPDPRIPASTSGEREQPTTDPRDHWAFQGPTRQPIPSVDNHDWPITDLDNFVLKRLEDEGLQPVPQADSRTLIRRAYFDLIGLPPTPDEVEAFVTDGSPDAYERLVDRLLDSPRFGERWGRHWLDIARYGESTGHERNFLYPHAWRYRDYVIASFNEDKPYDQFIMEQVAGDLLPADTQGQRDEQAIATGFLAIGPRNLLARGDQFSLDTVDDQINVTTRAILGLTASCARCHDHKFDPISTKEYYALAGIFLSTKALYGTKPGSGGGNNRHPSDLIPIGERAQRLHERVTEHQKKIATATKEFNNVDNRFKKIKRLPEAEQQSQADELEQLQAERQQLEARLKRLKSETPDLPAYAMGVRDAEEITRTAVRIGGDARNEGDTVDRGVLSCCGIELPEAMPDDSSGRLQLARWLVDPEHPLTARVMVNRIWYHLLGQGLVETVDNFGVNGRSPSHPELLDYLAIQFRHQGWSIKQAVREIMLSRVYRLSANHDPRNVQIDPANRYYWRYQPQRLEGEVIRDAMLAVSGRLQRCPPEQGSVVAVLGDGCLVRQVDADRLEVDASYRSVYLPNARFFEPESLQIFDGASASLVVGRRAETNVPAQSLYLLNNKFVIEQAQQAAARLLEQHAERDARIERIYRLAFGRSPTLDEYQQASQFVDRAFDATTSKRSGSVQKNQGPETTSGTTASERQIWAGLVQALFASAEFRFVY